MSEEDSFESTTARRVRRNPWTMALGASPFAAFVALVVAAIATGLPALLVPCIHATIFGLLGIAYAYNRNPWPRLVPTKVVADREGLRVEPGLFVPRAQIKEAFVVPQPGGTIHVLVRRKGARLPIQLQVDSEAEGQRLLHALGFDASQTVARFSAMSRAVADRTKLTLGAVGVGVGSALIGVAGGALHFGALPVVMVPIVLAFVALMVAPTRLDVGADGMLMRWFFWRRFLPFEQIESITHFDEGWGRSRYVGINVRLRSGEVIRIPVTQSTWNNGRVATIEQRLHEAVQAWRKGGAHADASVLARARETSIRDWIAHLRAMGSGALATHRIAPVLPDTLWRIVEDPSARPHERAAAAVALSGALDDEAKGRLRVAADATAEPKLRIALDCVASAKEDDALAEALEEMEKAGA